MKTHYHISTPEGFEDTRNSLGKARSRALALRDDCCTPKGFRPIIRACHSPACPDAGHDDNGKAL